MPQLPMVTLGATGLRVTNLCLGGAPLGDMPETFAYGVPEERALATVRALFDSPINFIDTAASYGDTEGSGASVSSCASAAGCPPDTSWRAKPTATCRPAISAATRCAAASSGACGCSAWRRFN